jgi:hypothetical protein
MTPNIADIIRRHVSLEVRCIDRMYLHAYMPKLQTSGGLCYFLRDETVIWNTNLRKPEAGDSQKVV